LYFYYWLSGMFTSFGPAGFASTAWERLLITIFWLRFKHSLPLLMCWREKENRLPGGAQRLSELKRLKRKGGKKRKEGRKEEGKNPRQRQLHLTNFHQVNNISVGMAILNKKHYKLSKRQLVNCMKQGQIYLKILFQTWGSPELRQKLLEAADGGSIDRRKCPLPLLITSIYVVGTEVLCLRLIN
jgi:hypothetical protein